MAESHSPIASLPPEIADRVCAKFRTPDVKSLRLVSTFWMNVATPWLLPRVHLIFTSDSFQRMVDISEHPVIRHHVTSLFYEPDTLTTYHSQKEWQNSLDEPRSIPLENFVAVPQPVDTERELRVFRREVARLRNPPRYPQRYLRQAYAEYVRLYNEQHDLRLRNYGAATIRHAMSRFPKLSKIYMSLGCSIVPRSDYVYQAYAATLQMPYGDEGHIMPSGVTQMRSLLLGADLAQLQLTCLKLGDVHWTFLRAPDQTFLSMKKALKGIRSLTLIIATANDGDEDGMIEMPECREYLKNGRLNDFLIAAPGLEDLWLAFNWHVPYNPFELKYIVGSFTWSSLRNVAFGYLDTAEEEWVAFFVRHSRTLRRIAIKTIRLVTGMWVVVLERMSEVLKLEFADFRGLLMSDDPLQHWYLERARGARIDDLQDQGNKTREALGRFLVSGGICPLRDEQSHPQAR